MPAFLLYDSSNRCEGFKFKIVKLYKLFVILHTVCKTYLFIGNNNMLAFY